METMKIFAASILWYPLFLVPALIGFVPFGFIHRDDKRFVKSDFFSAYRAMVAMAGFNGHFFDWKKVFV